MACLQGGERWKATEVRLHHASQFGNHQIFLASKHAMKLTRYFLAIHLITDTCRSKLLSLADHGLFRLLQLCPPFGVASTASRRNDNIDVAEAFRSRKTWPLHPDIRLQGDSSGQVGESILCHQSVVAVYFEAATNSKPASDARYHWMLLCSL